MKTPERNALCPCGSGLKYKKCHEAKDADRQSRLLLFAVGGLLVAALAAGALSFIRSGGSSDRIWSAEHGHYHNSAGQEIP